MNFYSTDKPYPRGEIQMKGPNVFSGYFKREDLTKAAFEEDRWFSSGDVGMFYPNASLAIIGRVKE
jgi:long-chain acyl-CoA synthetase